MRLRFFNRVLVLVLCTAASGTFAFAQDTGTMQVVVTEEAKKGASLPDLQATDLVVNVDKDRGRATALAPIRPGGAGLELMVLVDEGLDPSVANQFSEITRFMQSLPQSAYVGVGYLRNGGITVAQQPTNDHAQAAKALRIPTGDPGINPSPYTAVSDFVKAWQRSPQRAREIVLISDGVDWLYGGGPANPYVDTAVNEAQRASVVIYSIYAQGALHRGRGSFQTTWGQNNLGILSDATGGEMYGFGMGAPVSFAPYLSDISDHLKHQYLLTFTPPASKSGFKSINVQAEARNSDLVTQKRVYIEGGK